MPDGNGVTFTSEGGFRWDGPGPNPYTPPPQPQIVSWVRMSEAADQGWGHNYANAGAAVRANSSPGFGLIDRGSLLRIARATERVTLFLEGVLNQLALSRAQGGEVYELLRAALQPALRLTLERHRAARRAVRERLDAALALLEAAHGVCPPEVRVALRGQLRKLPAVAAALRGPLRVEGGEVFEAEDYQESLDAWRPAPPGAKGGKLRRAWDAWLMKTTPPAP